MMNKIRGENQKFGFIDKPLVVYKDNKLEWIIWTAQKQVPTSRELKVSAVQEQTGKTIVVTEQLMKKQSPIRQLP